MLVFGLKPLSHGYRAGAAVRAAVVAYSSPMASKTRGRPPRSDRDTIAGPSPGSWARRFPLSSAATDLAAVAVRVGVRDRVTETDRVSRWGRGASRRGGRSG